MISNEISHSYYEFLGVDLSEFEKGTRIFKSKNRDILINKIAAQQLILTRFGENLILSVSPEMYERYSKKIFESGISEAIKSNNRAKCVLLLREFADGNFLNYNYRTMERFVRTDKIKLQNRVSETDCILLLDHSHYDNYWQTIKFENSEGLSKMEFDEIWKRKLPLIKDRNQYIALENNIVVSYCKVSDVINNMANLVVYTSEFKRNHGYGKRVVTKMVNDCIDRKIIPTYWVSVENYHSKALLKSLDFVSIAKEDVISFD